MRPVHVQTDALLIYTGKYKCITHLYMYRQVCYCLVRVQTGVQLTCTCSHTAALIVVVVGVSSAASINERFAAARLHVVVPALERRSAGTHDGLPSAAH